MDWPLFVGAADTCNEVIFKGADGAFGGVSAMVVRWDELIVDILLGHESF
jgi:hypothetical protein